MSLKKNILANYVSQIYVAAVGILILPLYIQYLGAEAYGLVGFFTMLQAWFNLLDLGLTPTIGRETARYHGGSMTALAYRQLFRALSLIFASLALIGGGSLFLLAEVVATGWLNTNELAQSDVVLAVQIMAISVALRWMGGLYRGVITGSERLVWLSGFNMLIATLRFIAVFFSMWLYGFTPFVFFLHQLVVAMLEASGLFFMSKRLLPARHSEVKIGWSFGPVKPVLKFALTIAFTSSVWVLVTQTDKLILSGVLSLSEYGYFTLAVLVASGVMVISGPISSAIMPRLAKLYAEGKNEQLMSVYRNATQVVSVICGSAAITIAFNAEPLLYAWTANSELAAKAAPILRLYVIGNGFLALAAFSYYLQYANGNLRYHLIGNAALVLMLIPSIVYAATHYGAVGAGYVWMLTNGVFFLCWVAYVHHKFAPGLHWQWLSLDVVMIVLPALVVASALTAFDFQVDGRMQSLMVVTVSGCTTAISSALATTRGRQIIKKFSRFILFCGKANG